MRTSLIVAVAMLFAVSVCSGVVVEDFEGTYEGPGTLTADPENSSNTCLLLELVDTGGYLAPDVYEVDISSLADEGTVKMDIFDMGKYLDGSGYGPRWGIEGDLNSIAAGILEKSWLGCEAGYGIATSEYDNLSVGTIRTGDWWTAAYLGGPRQVDVLDSDATSAVVGADGAWQTWSFTVDESGYVTEIKMGDNVRYNRDSGLTATIPGWVGTLEDVWVSAGRGNSVGLDGVYVDNIIFEPLTPDYYPGDVDGDNDVDIVDFLILKSNYGTGIGATWEMGDLDADGDVDIVDFLILKSNYGWAM